MWKKRKNSYYSEYKRIPFTSVNPYNRKNLKNIKKRSKHSNIYEQSRMIDTNFIVAHKESSNNCFYKKFTT